MSSSDPSRGSWASEGADVEARGRTNGTRRPRSDGRLTGRRGLSPEEVASSQRRRLMDSIAELVAAKGYHDVTVAELVSRAGVSRATYYELFEDKRHCFVEALGEGAARLADALSAGDEGDEGGGPRDWGDRVELVVERVLQYVEEDASYVASGVIEALAAGPEAYGTYERAIGTGQELLSTGRRELPPDVELPACTERAVVGGSEWLIAGELIADRGGRIHELIPDFIYIACLPYLGQEEALDRMNAARERLE